MNADETPTEILPLFPEGSEGDFTGAVVDQKYRLDERLGRGGMGTVYRSTHLGTDRCVAVKLIAPEFMGDPAFVRRFQQEARAAGRLRHPNIVDVTDFGVASVEGRPAAYLVMEYLDGLSLAEALLKGGRLPLERVVDILEQVCSAVHEAHQKGIIHRDLKPANIWLEPNPLGGYRVKVLDFGIAKLADGEGTGGTPGVELTGSPIPMAIGSGAGERIAPADGSTRVGSILGTPAYMSPEQCRGDGLDGRSDIYSLGVVTHQMLSGRLPFTGDAGALIRAHQSTPPDGMHLRSVRVPSAVAGLVLSSIAKSPGDRPPTPKAFAQALRAHSEGMGFLIRRSVSLYSEFFPQILQLSLLAHLPVLALMGMGLSLRIAGELLGFPAPLWCTIPLGILQSVADFVAGSVIAGMIAVMVVGLTGEPLQPVTPQAILSVVRRRIRPLLKTSALATLRIIAGSIALVVPGVVLMVRYTVWAPVVLLEGLETRQALVRSRELAGRSWKACALMTLAAILLPIGAEALVEDLLTRTPLPSGSLWARCIEELASLIRILTTPLVSISMALVYLKLRRLGGELVDDVLPAIRQPPREIPGAGGFPN